jgi:mono/diheme cytochrome c family protein
MQFLALCVIAMFVASCSSPSTTDSGNNSAPVNPNGSTKSAAVTPYPASIDDQLAAKGKELYAVKCVACHQMDTKTIGPALRGVTSKRSYDWMLSMLENPEEWVKKDPEAKKLFGEYNNIPMIIPDGTTDEERKAIIEYLRKEG